MRAIAIIGLLLIHLVVVGQEVYFHFDKPLYLVDEAIQFKIYSPAQKVNREDASALVGLFTANGRLVENTLKNVTIRDGRVHGSLQIDSNAEEGIYQIGLFFNNKSYAAQLPVFQREVPEEYEFYSNSSENLNPVIDGLSLTASQDQFEAGEVIQMGIVGTGDEFLIPFNHSVTIHRSGDSFGNTLIQAVSRDYPLEIKSGVTGNVRLSNSDLPLDSKIVVAYFLKSKSFASTYCDAEGRVTIPLKDAFEDDEMYLQAFDRAGKRLGELFFSPEPTDNFRLTLDPVQNSIKRTQSVNNYIHQSIQIEKLSLMYGGPRRKNLTEFNQSFEFDDTVNPNKYDQLASFRDAVREIMNHAKIKKDRASKSEQIYLKNQDFVRYETPPLFLVNGIPLTDSRIVLEMDLEKVELIHLSMSSRTNRQFWQMGSFGVVSVELKEGENFKIPTEFVPVRGERSYSSYKITRPTSGPFFATSLYWSHDLITDKNNQLELELSDDASPFVVEVVGIGEDGRMRHARKIIIPKR